MTGIVDILHVNLVRLPCTYLYKRFFLFGHVDKKEEEALVGIQRRVILLLKLYGIQLTVFKLSELLHIVACETQVDEFIATESIGKTYKIFALCHLVVCNDLLSLD